MREHGIEQLASEYVLGTLTGRARARFQRLTRERSDIREAVWRWESRLGVLSAATPELTPPGSAWTAIEKRLWPDTPSGGLWNSLGLWRSWSALASAAAIAMVLLLAPAVPLPQGPDHVGVIGEGSEPLWLISANLKTGELDARAVNAEAAEVDKVFELWMLPASGSPVSIGLLPVSGGSITKALPAGLLALLKQSKGLAVSIEPAGGSPTGLPTGPVIYTANILAL
jgi:anti-sigma-K factor RskA